MKIVTCYLFVRFSTSFFNTLKQNSSPVRVLNRLTEELIFFTSTEPIAVLAQEQNYRCYLQLSRAPSRFQETERC